MCEDEGMSKKALEYEPIQIMETRVKELKRQWLQENGWKESCDFIDSCWRWVKEIPSTTKLGSKVYMCDMQEAINIEYNYLDQETPN